jgi:hypothetical protein
MEDDSKQVSAPCQVALARPEGAELATGGASEPTFGYYKLDAEQTKAEFVSLEAELDQRCESLARAQVTLEGATPYLKKMQALLSQRGDERHKVLKKAGLPTWSQWAKSYAEKIGSSVRTLQRHIKQLREEEKSCRNCGKKKSECACPELCSGCGSERAGCTCIKKVLVQEPYLEALERLVGVADRAADLHEDKELAEAVKYASSGISLNERLKLGIRPRETSQANGEADSSLTLEEAVEIFLTQQVRREFLTAITEESDLILVLSEMARVFYDSKQTSESEREVLITTKSERKRALSESIKAGIARKKAAQATPNYVV